MLTPCRAIEPSAPPVATANQIMIVSWRRIFGFGENRRRGARHRIQYRLLQIMPLLELMTSSGLGSLLGMRHALEPDHLAAVSTLVTGERNSVKAALLGACWGLGHTFSLIVVGTILVILRIEMPARVAEIFESGVALMLIGLGLRAIYLAVRQGPAGPVHVHHHGATVHEHHGAPAHIHIGTWTLARRPLIVGAVHGLAGSGAVTALVVATLPSAAARITY